MHVQLSLGKAAYQIERELLFVLTVASQPRWMKETHCGKHDTTTMTIGKEGAVRERERASERVVLATRARTRNNQFLAFTPISYHFFRCCHIGCNRPASSLLASLCSVRACDDLYHSGNMSYQSYEVSISDLSNELWFYILSYLKPTDVVAFSKTCHAFLLCMLLSTSLLPL
jgi:hypothetical protein